MSNSVWKTPDQKPDLYRIFAIKTDKGNAYTNILTNEKDWNPILLPSFYDIGDIDKAERITQYAYLDDLIAQADKAERLQKAVDLAVHSFNEICAGVPSDIWVFDEATKATNEIKQLIKE